MLALFLSLSGDFLEGKGRTQQILGEAFAALGIVRGHGFLSAVVDMETGVLPGEEVGEVRGAEVFAVTEGLEEAVAE